MVDPAPSRYDSFDGLLAEATVMRTTHRRVDEAWLSAIATAGGTAAFLYVARAITIRGAALAITGTVLAGPLALLVSISTSVAAGWMVARTISQVRASADGERVIAEVEKLMRARRDYDSYVSMRPLSETKFRERVDRLLQDLTHE